MSAPGKLRALAMFTPDRKRFLTRPCRHRQEKKDDYSREGWIQRTKRDEGVLVEDGDNSTNQLFDTGKERWPGTAGKDGYEERREMRVCW